MIHLENFGDPKKLKMLILKNSFFPLPADTPKLDKRALRGQKHAILQGRRGSGKDSPPKPEPKRRSLPPKLEKSDKTSFERLSSPRKVIAGVGAGLIAIVGAAMGAHATGESIGDGPGGDHSIIGTIDGTQPVITDPIVLADLLQQQINRINTMDLGTSNPQEQEQIRAFLLKAAPAVMNMKSYADQNHIRVDFMLAQAMLESKYGTSDKVESGQNYLGMKAKPGDGWEGPTFEAPTWEVVNGETIQTTATWRKYGSIEECFRGYVDNIAGKKTYDGARAHYENLLEYKEGMKPYATDPAYLEKVMALISRFGLTDLLYPPIATPQPETNPATVVQGKFKLQPENYAGNMQAQWNTNYPDDWKINYNGTLVKMNSLTWEQRYQMVEDALNGVKITKEDYEAFKKEYVDISDQVAALGLSNFDGSAAGTGLGAPKMPEGISRFVAHYTVTRPDFNGESPLKGAQSMQNGGKSVGSYAYLNNKGEIAQLTHSYVYHVLNANGINYNKSSWGYQLEEEKNYFSGLTF